MNKNTIILSFCIILFCFPGSSFGQKNFLPGYIVLNNQDTLHGLIKDRDIQQGKLYTKIRFKSENSRTKRYDAYDLISYRVANTTFESKWYLEDVFMFKFTYYSRYGKGKKIFLRVNVKGELTCYTNEYVDEDNSNIVGFELFQKEGDDFFQRANQGIFGLKKKALSSYFKDCPTLVNKINSGEIKTAIEVTEFYNSTCSKRSIIVNRNRR